MIKYSETKNYKLFLIVPITLLLIALIGFYHLSQKGFNKDIDLRGGNQLILEFERFVNIKSIENILKEYGAKVRGGKTFSGYSVFIELPEEVYAKTVIEKLEKNGYKIKNYSIQKISPVLGEQFFKQSIMALLIAFLLMGIVVFVIFKEILPSLYIIFAVFSNILETLVFSQFLGVPLSLASIAGILLLIGYSVDTDILLTSRVLRGEGELKARINSALKTGLTMSLTTLSAIAIVLLISSSAILTQIALILFIGLCCDLVNTWLGNAIMLRWWVEHKWK
jgi:preprotein translocase subunit SecF